MSASTTEKGHGRLSRRMVFYTATALPIVALLVAGLLHYTQQVSQSKDHHSLKPIIQSTKKPVTQTINYGNTTSFGYTQHMGRPEITSPNERFSCAQDERSMPQNW